MKLVAYPGGKRRALFAHALKAIIILAILSLLSLSSYAATLSVALDGSQAYTAIQEAIDASADNDIVLVYPGRYYENVQFNGKNISLASLELLTGNRDYVYSTIIDANHSGPGVRTTSGESNIHVQGFTITNGTGDYNVSYDMSVGGGIIVSHMSGQREASIINCVVTGNTATNGGGFWGGVCNLYLSGVSIHNNTASAGGGMHFEGALTTPYSITFDPVNRCSIYSNYAAFGSDLYYYNVDAVHVVVDTFTVASPWNFYATAVPRNPNISNPYTFDIQNTVHEEVNHDLYVAPWGDNANSGLSPAEPMQSIFMAMYRIASDSENPKTVHVANGHYSPSLNGQLFPISIKSYTRLLGESREGTILDAESNHINFMIPPSSVSWIAKNLSLINSKGGIGSNRSGDFRLENIEISNVYSSYSPKGISWAYVHGQIELENVNINKVRSDRRAVAFDSFQTSGSLKLHNVEISNCEAPESMRIMDITTQNECDILIDGCEFHDNRSPSSDMFSANSMFQIYPFDDSRLRIEMRNTAFYDNHQGTLNHMGMARSLNDTLFISNCSFAGNTGGSSTIAVQGTSVLTNNVFYNPDMNTQILIPNYISSGIYSPATLINNNILGGSSGVYSQTAQNPVIWGPGNTSHEPLFTAEGNRPYTLSPVSPLIDAGWQPSLMMDQAVDAGGNERYWDGDGDGITVIDVGAYEYQPMYAPLDLVGEAWQQQISLSWQMPLMDRGLSGFRIYRNDDPYADLPDASLRYFRDFSAVNDTLSCYVVALYGSVESAASNSVSVVISGVENQDELSFVTPNQISISPNPFKTLTNIEISLSKSAKTQVNIYNIRGQKVRILFDDIMAKGTQILSWDGTDAHGNGVCAGVYLARIESGTFKQSHKMILLK
ncbi:MAG: T9SS type A sorting domain-containing protein [Candidatus Cloacimonetes bacterium]|nr:T9SS type A sorting domain-containing protein [Candidatus Cloacimonadota bacterium]MDY0229522.1 T9SS type A sorting domain-containing protein [Candidatus Cloacimonadaceae bacterium]